VSDEIAVRTLVARDVRRELQPALGPLRGSFPLIRAGRVAVASPLGRPPPPPPPPPPPRSFASTTVHHSTVPSACASASAAAASMSSATARASAFHLRPPGGGAVLTGEMPARPVLCRTDDPAGADDASKDASYTRTASRSAAAPRRILAKAAAALAARARAPSRMAAAAARVPSNPSTPIVGWKSSRPRRAEDGGTRKVTDVPVSSTADIVSFGLKCESRAARTSPAATARLASRRNSPASRDTP